MLASDARRSGRYGPRRLAVAHWQIAKVAPQAMTAGRISIDRRNPTMMRTM